MFDIVNDVECYSQFVPWCTESHIIRQVNPDIRICTLSVGFPPLTERYTSRVTSKPFVSIQSIASNSSMFKHLINQWEFRPGIPNNDRTCTVEFKVDFEFRSALHSQLSQLFFDQVVKVMVTAFLSRAGKVHGPEAIRRQKPEILEYVNN
ncbi:Coenzyme Q-binding protein COQ10 B, mitochondrial [Cichlidogyrus casuarinus]|uniref:Coenzyme Q-binding protein COQ10 B, mitochondrial n=1 Tax=Cichlidogyrus casuarinus TaxID=1844966 RepID=A0ABD2PWQ5_9PLAT